MKKVFLTGITGFVGSHTAIQLLNKNYQVIGTLRNMERANEIKNVIAQHTKYIENLQFVEADLNQEKSWDEYMQGVDYVLHIASPFPQILPKNEDDLIIPAKKGTLNILQSASKMGVKRIVITSSSGAIVYGKEKGKQSGFYNENDWTNPTNKQDSTPYFRSKTIAEQSAWDFIKQDTSGLELVTICPGAILGEILEKDFGTSANIVIKTMDGSSPAIPQIGFDMVDVRSVAEMHIQAIEVEEASGERFICSSGFLSFKDVATILKEKYPKAKIPSFVLPNFLVRLFANFEPTLKPILIDLSIERRLDNTKAKKILNWNPISPKDAVLACAESLIKLGVLKIKA